MPFNDLQEFVQEKSFNTVKSYQKWCKENSEERGS